MKNVLITGANHGLGLSLAEVFLNNGHTVFAGIYKLNADSLINRIKHRPGLYLIDMDVSDTASIKSAAAAVGEICGALDILINNAGIIAIEEVQDQSTFRDELDYDSITRVINVNALGALRVANCFSMLLMNGGNKLVVNISSEAGSIADSYRDSWFGYCMSKAALNMAGNIIHNELKKHGGQVMQIHPGYLQTYMNGYKNESATYSPDFSAENIFKLIENADQYKSEKAAFLDLFGNKMNW